jgi:hypothetical protein
VQIDSAQGRTPARWSSFGSTVLEGSVVELPL